LIVISGKSPPTGASVPEPPVPDGAAGAAGAGEAVPEQDTRSAMMVRDNKNAKIFLFIVYLSHLLNFSG
jgi:hypothetical protein